MSKPVTVCYIVHHGADCQECSTMREAYKYAGSWLRLGRSLWSDQVEFAVTVTRLVMVGGFVSEEWAATLTKGNVS